MSGPCCCEHGADLNCAGDRGRKTLCRAGLSGVVTALTPCSRRSAHGGTAARRRALPRRTARRGRTGAFLRLLIQLSCWDFQLRKRGRVFSSESAPFSYGRRVAGWRGRSAPRRAEFSPHALGPPDRVGGLPCGVSVSVRGAADPRVPRDVRRPAAPGGVWKRPQSGSHACSVRWYRFYLKIHLLWYCVCTSDEAGDGLHERPKNPAGHCAQDKSGTFRVAWRRTVTGIHRPAGAAGNNACPGAGCVARLELVWAVCNSSPGDVAADGEVKTPPSSLLFNKPTMLTRSDCWK